MTLAPRTRQPDFWNYRTVFLYVLCVLCVSVVNRFWFGRQACAIWRSGDGEHLAGVFRVPTPACAHHARRWRMDPQLRARRTGDSFYHRRRHNPAFLPNRAFSIGFPGVPHVPLGLPETMKRRLNDRQLAQPWSVDWGASVDLYRSLASCGCYFRDKQDYQHALFLLFLFTIHCPLLAGGNSRRYYNRANGKSISF